MPQPKGGSRKGIPNKTSATAKQALHDAFTQIGGPQRFARWAKENETEFYRLWSKLVPTEVSGMDGGPLVVTVRFGNE